MMLDKTYDPKAIEDKWYKHWEASEAFVPRGTKAPYCIVIPPPNVTGSLHMGHAFQDTLMDALIRYHRMQGQQTLWQVGTDHAGIATQMVVERQLLKDNISRHDLGREAFVKKIWEWKAHSGSTITQQLKRLGASVDWSCERFTMDETLSQAVQTVFIQLYEEGLIYRGKRLVNWDPILHTAVSDLEVISNEEEGSLWHLRYPLEGSEEHLTVATTRPETMLGDAAVAVHPDDPRYKKLIGRHVRLPLTNRLIPIVGDYHVEPAFGTGCVKVTPAHDFNDYEIGLRHNLEPINIFTKDAKLNHNTPQAYQHLDRFEARKKIVHDLNELKLLAKIDKHVLKIPRGDRSGAVIEPYLTDQWFVKIEPLAKEALKVVEEKQIQFVPDNWTKTYYEWMRNIQDWCISRQLWWGHRIPAWYDEQGHVYVAATEQDVRAKHHLREDVVLTQDEDVLDTWFSSALWPFSSLGWPEHTPEYQAFYPNTVLVTGFDIIFFWVARMIMFGLKFTGKVPFKTVYIHGLIQDHEGQKMSKSKGNVIDPIDLIDGISLENLIQKRLTGLMQPEKAPEIMQKTRAAFPNGFAAFGTDALRLTFCAMATQGRHLRFEMGRIETFRNFCNKLWNAARYVLMQTQEKDNGFADHADVELNIIDRWILSRWEHTKQNIHKHFEHYRFDLLVEALYEFVWGEYCDWYLELTKPVLLDDPHPNRVRGTRHTLLVILDEILRVMHPLAPFLTEEIWEKIKPFIHSPHDHLITAPYPKHHPSALNRRAQDTVEWMKAIILAIRQVRGEMNIPTKKTLRVLLKEGTRQDRSQLTQTEALLKALANVERFEWLTSDQHPPQSISQMIGSMTVLIPMAGLIDKDAELARLGKVLAKLEADIATLGKKLNNPSYVSKAPIEVVEKTRAEFETLMNSLEKIRIQKASVAAM